MADSIAPILSNWTNLIGNPSRLLFSFNETIKIGTGKILFRTYGTDATDGEILETYNLAGVATTNVSLNTNVAFPSFSLNVNPSIALTALSKLTSLNPTQAEIDASSYVIEFYTGSIKDTAGNDFGKGLTSQVVVFTYTDTANYDYATTPALTVNLITDDSSVKASGGYWDILIGIKNVIAGPLNDTLIGDASANRLEGRGGNDTLDGRGGSLGNDRLFGGVGDDNYKIDNITERMVENANEGTDSVNSSVTWTLGANFEKLTLTGTTAINGTGNNLDNMLTGNTGNNSLEGAIGDDTLEGGVGIDTMIGSLGNDTYSVDSTTDTITENVDEGTDTLQSSISITNLIANIENLTLTGTTAINGTGNSLANTITGNVNANSLNGGDGDDIMIGDKGNDIYSIDSAGDVVKETSTITTEIDEVKSSVTFTLGANVEKLTLIGTTAIDGTGNALNNTMTGNAADNILVGSGGVDTFLGGTGNDTYTVNNSSNDRITENTNEGIDSIFSAFTYTLPSEVENLTLTGAEAISGTGNISNNILNGNSGNNTLIGAIGSDTLTGGMGQDTYKYASTTHSGDKVAFSVTDVDIIDLSAITSLTTASYGEYATTNTDITVNNNIIVYGTTSAISIDTAASAIAADSTVTTKTTKGWIIVPDGAGNTLVYHTTSLAANGTETLMLTLTGVVDASTLDSTMFLV